MASVIWRKRRVLQAEGATINQGLKIAARSAKTVIPAAAPFELGLSGDGTDIGDLMDLTPKDVAERQRDARHDLDATRKAAAILRKGDAKSYEKALRALLPDSRDWWEEYVAEDDFAADAAGLASFIQEHLDPLCMEQEKEARHHEAIRNQTLGEGLIAMYDTDSASSSLCSSESGGRSGTFRYLSLPRCPRNRCPNSCATVANFTLWP